jgi:hypothetical protein
MNNTFPVFDIRFPRQYIRGSCKACSEVHGGVASGYPTSGVHETDAIRSHRRLILPRTYACGCKRKCEGSWPCGPCACYRCWTCCSNKITASAKCPEDSAKLVEMELSIRLVRDIFNAECVNERYSIPDVGYICGHFGLSPVNRNAKF